MNVFYKYSTMYLWFETACHDKSITQHKESFK